MDEASYRHYVEERERAGPQRGYDVEGCFAADVDQGDEDADDCDDEDCVEGDGNVWAYLWGFGVSYRWSWGLGECRVGAVRLTCAIQREKGTPLSRAKAKSWREALAVQLTQANMERMMMIAVMMLVPWRDWVEL